MAMMIPDEVVNRVRQETNIVDVVSQYVQLKKVVRIYLVSVHSMMKRHLLFQLQKKSKSFIVLVVVEAVMSLLFNGSRRIIFS